uniref:Chondroitin proteoglycan 4 domain-containing protein n=1 Tax=Strongyloides stercoralis TaxID=6248 RepID=A0A0K0EN13_STRER
MGLLGGTVSGKDPCLMRCKDTYMNAMQLLMSSDSSRWTVDLVTPLQSLLSSKKNIYSRIQNSCYNHNTFLKCLGTCRQSKATQSLLLGQESWNTLCYSFENEKDFKKYIIPCWSKYGDQISSHCHIHALMVQNSIIDLMQHGFKNFHDDLSDLCRSTTIYDKCYIWQTDRFCGEKGWNFLLKLSQKSSAILVKMINATGLLEKLPDECEQWMKPNEYAQWHIERLRSFRQMRNKSIKILYSLPLNIIIFIITNAFLV